MPYTFNTKDLGAYGLIDDGKYEVYIKEALIKTTPSGKEKISIQYKIRDDIEQKFQNRIIFEDIWKERDTEFFNRKRLNQLLGTQHLEDGKVFDGIQDLLASLVGANLVIKVNKEFDDYRQEEINRVYYYESSKNQPKKVGENKNLEKIEIADEDLPF
jgi:hypothetical protein